ncbi:rCG43510, partial [Rattus norvegicus]
MGNTFGIHFEAHQRISPGILAGPSHSHWIMWIQQRLGCFCWIITLLLIPVWYPDTTELDCWCPGNGDWNHLKELLLNRSTPPCPIHHLFPLPLKGGLEVGSKHL